MKFWDKRTAGPIKAIHPATGKVIEVNPQQDAKISSDIDKELRRLPALLSWYMSLRDRAETWFRDVRHSEYNISEDLYSEIRERNPKATETAIKMAVKKDARMRKAYRDRMDAEDMHQKLKSAVETFIQKGYMLTNLTNIYKSEHRVKDHA